MAAEPSLRLYNSLTRAKEDFVPIDAGNVRMYVCGPTVYDDAHIGNARPVIVFDLLYRLLRHVYGEAHVTYARNITDVDDKINARAARDYPDMPLNEAIRRVTEATAAQYARDVAALGALTPDIEPRATGHIPEMVAMIETLIERRHAYVAEGHVLFEVRSFNTGNELAYGRLSKRPLEDMIAGARVEVAPYKRDPMDFVLWKPSSPDEPGWDSPWGRGRPGWHVECSAMSEKHLGRTFDIHGGGIDLIFPHHENEIAQSRCAHGTPVMANVWMHNGFLLVEGRKMAKSEGNFITIHELLETDRFGGRRWPGEVLRLATLMTHYREPIDFSLARLEEAEKKLRDWQRAAAAATRGVPVPPEPTVMAELMDDLNFHRAAVAIDVIARKARRGTQSAADCLAATLEFLGFGLDSLLVGDVSADASAEIEEAVNRRLAALNAKDFATADRIRAELLEQGIQLMDGKDAAGDRITRWEAKR